MAFEYASEARIERIIGLTGESKTTALTEAEAQAQAIFNSECDVVTFNPIVGATQKLYELYEFAYLENKPVTNITSIVSYNDHAGSTTDTIDTDTYHLDTRLSKIIYTGGRIINQFGIVVTYNHGYSTIPEDLAGAVAKIAARIFLQSGDSQADKRFDLNTKTVGETVMQFKGGDFPEGVQRVIDKYRRYSA